MPPSLFPGEQTVERTRLTGCGGKLKFFNRRTSNELLLNVASRGGEPEHVVSNVDHPEPEGQRLRKRAVARAIFWVFAGSMVSLGAVLLGAASWIRRTFGRVSIDQMLMNLPGAGGAATTGAETGYIESFVWQAVIVPLSIVVILVALSLIGWAVYLYFTGDRGPGSEPGTEPVANSAARKRKFLTWTPSLLGLSILVLGATVFAQSVGLEQYVRSSMTDLTMAEYYKVPELDRELTVELSANESSASKLNLVTIYLESVDDGFSDADTFGDNLLLPLEEVTSSWTEIPELLTYEGGGWTMAGIVGTQCGVPLRGPGVGENDINSNEIGADFQDFMPGAVCLGDVLAAEGYTSVFLGGADAEFASKGNFLRSHGYEEVHDMSYWQEQGETEFSQWGLSDRALMEQAKAEVTRLHESGEPFNLTALTLDFHEPLQVYEYCDVTDEVPLSSVLRCSNQQVAGFISYMEDMGYLEDTVVVLMADHPKMLAQDGTYWSELGALGLSERTLFNRIWSPNSVQLGRDSTDQLSMFATILDLLGMGQDNALAGVGVSVLGPFDDASAALGLSQEQYTELLQSRSADLYGLLWGSKTHELVEAGAE